MIHSLKDMLEYQVYGTDGPIGDVLDFFIDDSGWRVRYLVAEPENDLTQLPAVLLSAVSLDPPQQDDRRIPVKTSREQVRNSPDIDLEQPLSRQQEIELHDYYSWPFYWGPATLSGMGPGNLLAAYPLIESKEAAEDNPDASLEDDPRLRSLSRLIDFRIQARDGEVGQVEDVLVDGEKWHILYVIVGARAWSPGKRVLLSPSWVEEVDWEAGEVRYDLERETIRNSPEYDPREIIDQDYEDRLYRHYGRRRD